MVKATAGRRSGTSRRRPSGGGEQQRLVAVALAARVVMVTSASPVGSGDGGDGSAGRGRCIEELLDCLLGVLRALGIPWAMRPPRQPRTLPPRGAIPAAADGRSFAAELRQIRGRITGNGACAVASLYTMQGKKGVNQDAMIVWENFCSRDDTIFCGVFDGHGPYGHLVAKRVRDLLPVKLGADLGKDEGRETSTSNMKSNTNEVSLPLNPETTETSTSARAEQNVEHPEIFTTFRTSFLRAFHVMDRDLKLHKNIDCFFSGTTAVAVLKQGHNLIIGNLGDSRAVLCTRNEDEQLIAVQLTVDLKPNIPSYLSRAGGGLVRRLYSWEVGGRGRYSRRPMVGEEEEDAGLQEHGVVLELETWITVAESCDIFPRSSRCRLSLPLNEHLLYTASNTSTQCLELDVLDPETAEEASADLQEADHGEAQRIRQSRGRIFALPEEPEVARVWLPKYNSPGLAMARAFGDFCLKEYGLISMPDVSCHRITEKDEFIVLATDGVWDVLSNTEVVSIISRATSQASAARFLVESANRAWRIRYPTSKIDDCAVVCLFLNAQEANKTSSSAHNNLANVVEVSGDKHSAIVQLSAGVSAELVTAVVKDRDELCVDTLLSQIEER